MKKISSVVVGMAVLALAICSLAAEPQQTDASLTNTEWQLVRLGEQKIALPKVVRRVPSILLNPEGNRVAGFGGCNRLMGSYELMGQDLSFKNMATTKMACPGDAMKFETAFMQALSGTRGWTIVGGKLTIVDGTGKGLAEFRTARAK